LRLEKWGRSLNANQGPKTIGSPTIPMIAAAPPAAAFAIHPGAPKSSRARRRTVTASVMMAGTKASEVALGAVELVFMIFLAPY
jgi:hypothetical protein